MMHYFIFDTSPGPGPVLSSSSSSPTIEFSTCSFSSSDSAENSSFCLVISSSKYKKLFTFVCQENNKK